MAISPKPVRRRNQTSIKIGEVKKLLTNLNEVVIINFVDWKDYREFLEITSSDSYLVW